MPEPDALQQLLDPLCRGDTEAVRRAFVAYEPYLRMVVRRQLTASLRVRFDSMDVVQSIWADLLEGFRAGGWRFETADQLRSFLVRATRNRLIDRVRRERMGLLREQGMDPAGLESLSPQQQPAAADGLEAEELWQRLLLLCPPQHRELLDLKRQGLALAEIAQRTKLHESSVRRILYDLSAKLAEEGAEG
jgi:RNA polymerase sigma-70 factor (ECF subfamily)